MKDICAHWNLGHAGSVINLVGKQNIRHKSGLQKGVRAFDAAGHVVHEFFPMMSCDAAGFNASNISKAVRTGAPYRDLTWRLFP